MYTIFAFWKLNDTLYSIPAFRNCGNCSYTTAQQDMIIFYSGTCAIFMQVLLLQAIILTWVWPCESKKDASSTIKDAR